MTTSTTIPRATFAKLSPHPFLLASLQPTPSPTARPTRTNGRAPAQARPPQLNRSSLTHAHGSAVVRAGDTAVICGVRGELLPAASIPQLRDDRAAAGGGEGEAGDDDALRAYDLLVPNVELATGAAPGLLPGAPPTPLAQTLSTRVYELLHACRVLDAGDLRVEREEAAGAEEGAGGRRATAAYWTLYIDLLVVSLDGNAFDAAWAAVLAALRDTRLPRARWDADREAVVCARGGDRRLRVRGLPIACSAAVFLEKEHAAAGAGAGAGGHWVLVDPDRLEEGLCREKVTVVVDRSGGGVTRVRSLSKSGGTVLGREEMRELVRVAEGRWEEFRRVME